MTMEQFGERLNAMVDNGLPSLLESISSRYEDNAKHIRNESSPISPFKEWADKEALAWEHATVAINTATESTWNTLPGISIGERGAY